MNRHLLSAQTEEAFEYEKWRDQIPYISFPVGWKVKMVPPFAGAVVRFSVKHPEVEEDISVYLDCYDMLGIYSNRPRTPYWEIFPYFEDTARCRMEDTDKLIRLLSESFESMKGLKSEG